MIGIAQIGVYIPENRQSNLELLDKFDVTEDFIRDKIGVLSRARKQPNEKSSDLCIRAFDNLKRKIEFSTDDIDCCVVVTQNPDFNIPHVSAIVHGTLGLPDHCACFDISLGCSGYVYALSVVSAFMQANGMSKGLLFTADPYSEIIDENDKNTVLIFGDGASVTLLDTEARLVPLAFDFGTDGSGYMNLINKEKIFMNGRAVFNFSATRVPQSIESLLEKTGLCKEQIDRWYLHQGSKYIVDTISRRAVLDASKVMFGMHEYGNTVSSSIPILLADDLSSLQQGAKIGISGFGVGLSWASAILEMR